MGADGENIALKREGTTRGSRFLEALSPETVRLNDFDLKDWMTFAHNFAKHINFFAKNNSQIPSGNWQSFFKSENEIHDFLKQVQTGGDVPPHLALFVSFIRLLAYPQQQFNRLTKRHLDFYYKEILQINRLPATADKVYVLFELAKKTIEENLSAGTLLNAGKDPLEKPLVYKTIEDFTINRAKIKEIKALYNDKGTLKIAELKGASDDSTPDSMDEKSEWKPFVQNSLNETTIGFAVASPVLEIREGNRKVIIEITLEEKIDSLDNQDVEIWFTGEKEWIKISDVALNLKSTGKTISISCNIPLEENAIIANNPSIHAGSFLSDNPICKIIFQKNTSFLTLKNKVTGIKISVDVQEIESIDIENDNGKLNPVRSFYPFGTQPAKGSDFFISYPELRNKPINEIKIDWEWKKLPDSFIALYGNYKRADERVIVSSDDYFRTSVSVPQKNDKKRKVRLDKSLLNLFANNNNRERFSVELKMEDSINMEIGGSIGFKLNQSFLHELYPKILMEEMIKETGRNIPDLPYTPLAANISLGYHASTEQNIEIFHLHPFGQAEVSTGVNLLPEYNNSMFLIGIEDIKPLQTVSLLVQLSEGTENPKVESGTVTWWILIQNKWRSLDENYLIKDETDNFLKTGLVWFSIPEDANMDNTLLPSGLIWIKAAFEGDQDAFCQCINIYTQAALAQFENNKNDETHLKNGLPAQTISKLVQRKSAIKTIDQPHSSFGGKPQETDKDYYLRISERLRHKNRVITIWDYEHLVLQQFSEVYKIRCLNHTSKKSFLAPGNVCLIVVPDIINHNVFDVYQPRLSKAVLNKITTFLEEMNGLMVNIWVENPSYEEVKVDLKAKFRSGFDTDYYTRQLKKDITHFISPWTHKTDIELKFSKSIHKSEVIFFVENLEYVDYVEAVVLYKKENDKFKEYQNVEPRNPKGVLCSVKHNKHGIKSITTGCNN